MAQVSRHSHEWSCHRLHVTYVKGPWVQPFPLCRTVAQPRNNQWCGAGGRSSVQDPLDYLCPWVPSHNLQYAPDPATCAPTLFLLLAGPGQYTIDKGVELARMQHRGTFRWASGLQ